MPLLPLLGILWDRDLLPLGHGNTNSKYAHPSKYHRIPEAFRPTFFLSPGFMAGEGPSICLKPLSANTFFCMFPPPEILTFYSFKFKFSVISNLHKDLKKLVSCESYQNHAR